MSLVTLTNKTGGQLVCPLKNGTLRLDNNKSKPVKDTELTPHIDNLIKNGLVLSEEVPETKKKETNAPKQSKGNK